jgi:lipopolysaccharide transport system ATP-binding protein
MTNPAITLENVSKIYRIYDRPADRLKQSLVRGRKHYFREYHALQSLTLSVPKGQTIGVIGCNGSGKSTLLQLIAGTLTPSTGTITVEGRVSALLELGAGFNPHFSGHDNIYLSGSIMGLSHAEIKEKYSDIIAFSGLSEEAVHQEVSTYSSGMYVRLAFATAIAINPDILIVDEALAVGDEGFQRKCFARIRVLQERGTTIFFVSHSARTIIDLCDYALWLDKGALMQQGNPAQVVASYHQSLFAPSEGMPATQHHATPETHIRYASNGAEISAVRLTTLNGEPCVLWQQGESYQLHYDVYFTRDVTNIRCSMMIKTMTGIELTGCLYHGNKMEFQEVKAGQHIRLTFTIPCRLSKGDYFLNVGVVEEQFGTYHFLHRIVDAAHIKVYAPSPAPVAHSQATGIIDVGIQPSCLLFS